jgi:uncharacterized protein YbjT (DUF2867 family)
VRILITGVSGYAGSVLARRLAGDGHELHGLARDPGRVDPDLGRGRGLGVTVHRGDALTGAGLAGALDGVEVAYYLIHSMEPARGGPAGDAGGFAGRERQAAERFAGAAAAAGVGRIVYLGGLVPAGGAVSAHLRSRQAVEEILLGAVPGSVVLRAPIVVGAGSRSFRLLVRLVERIPVLALPPWRVHRTQPLYGAMIARVADLMLVGRPPVRLGFALTPVASVVAARIAGEELELAEPLMESLATDLLADDREARARLGVRLHGYDAAVERALRDWERHEPLRAR